MNPKNGIHPLAVDIRSSSLYAFTERGCPVKHFTSIVSHTSTYTSIYFSLDELENILIFFDAFLNAKHRI